jgi:hypothetical protein
MSTRLAQPSLPRPGLRLPAGLLLTSFVGLLGGAPSSAGADKPRRISIAAYGHQLTNLGVRVGYEQAFWQRGVSELFAAGALGGHSGPDPGYSLFGQLEVGYRATRDSARAPVFFDVRLGIGYSPWFRSQGRGGVEAVINQLTPTALAGFGVDFSGKGSAGLGLFALAGAMGRYDFQSTFFVDALMILGLQYRFGRTKASPPPMPVPPVPPAIAPAFPEDAGGLVPSPAVGPAEPAPPEPPIAAPPLPPPTLPADLPQLPPPPTVPYAPPAGR